MSCQLQCGVQFRSKGFSYVEILVAVTLIAILLVPALKALQAGIQGSDIHREGTIDHYYLAGRFEEVLAQSYTNLLAEANAVGDETVPTSYSDAAGDPNRRLVFLSAYDVLDSDADGNPFTGGDGSLDAHPTQ